MRLARIAVVAGLLTAANSAHALERLFTLEPLLIPDNASMFVGFPAVVAGFIGITPGVIVGIPLAAVGGTLTTLVEGNPGPGATAGIIVGVLGSYQTFSNAVGLPLWAAESVFYDLPKAAFTDESDQSVEEPTSSRSAEAL